MDAGIVSLDPTVDAQFRVISLGRHPYVPLPPSEGLPVRKRGATTELTEGVVEEVDVIVHMRIDNLTVVIGGYGAAFSIRPDMSTTFASPGDSGSLIVDADGGATRGIVIGGELPAGANQIVYACSLNAIMEELELETPCTGAMDAMFAAALRRRWLLASVDQRFMSSFSPTPMKKFRVRYMKAAAPGSIGRTLEDTFQALGPELAEGLALDDDFAGLMDRAIGDIIVQPTVFDMLEYRLPADFGERLVRAFARLADLNPKCRGFEWMPGAFDNCGGMMLRDLLARPATSRGDSPTAPAGRVTEHLAD